MGGSVWLRAGFSDPLTLLLAMDCTVELYQGDGKLVQIPIAEFCRQKPDNSILTAVHIQKTGRKIVYQSFRNTETDNRKRDFFLADAMVSYQLSKRCDLELNATNLLDEREYAYTTFTNEASTVSRSYRIRPRNLLLTARFTF